MKRLILLPLFLLFWSAAMPLRGQDVVVKPLFPCTDTLRGAYGFCSHITRESTDYPLRHTDLEKTREAGASWVRADLDWWTLYHGGTRQGETPAVFDTVVADCRHYGVEPLLILDARCGGKWAWECPDDYERYLSFLARRYAGRLTHWEVVNEVNLVKGYERKELADYYAGLLCRASGILREASAQNRVVFGGLAEMDEAFLSEMGRHEGYDKWFDVMNFHSYLTPEELMPCMERLRGVMDRQGWHKPVWITETGYPTPPSVASVEGFYREVVPHACRELGIDVRRATLGVVSPVGTHLECMGEGSDELLRIFGKVMTLTLDDLATLDPAKVPLLLPSVGEYFPATHIDHLLRYVARGGTLICPTGVPFYYDDFEDARYVNRHGSHADKFHMHFLLWWNDDARQLGAPEIPTGMEAAEGCPIRYRWPFSANSSARYITTAALRSGDTFTPYLYATSERFRGAVAGLFRFHSDLKGNIIIQTRIDRPWRDEHEQARRVARAFLIPFAHGVDRVFWYHLRAFENDSIDWEHHFGVLHKDFSPKPAYEAYKTLTRFCPDGSTRPSLTVRQGLYHARWVHPTLGPVSAWWSPGTRKEVHLPRRPRSVYSHLGERQKATRHLQVGSGVMFVVE